MLICRVFCSEANNIFKGGLKLNIENVYRKEDPSEVIEIGDVIQINPLTGLVAKAQERFCSSRFVIGVCSATDNESYIPTELNAGTTADHKPDVNELEAGTARIDENLIIYEFEADGADISPREKLTVAQYGVVNVKTVGMVCLGDKLSISYKPGYAISERYDRNFERRRTFGKVIALDKVKDNVATVLLDIE